MKRLWLLPFLTVVLIAADISGKWAGNIEVEDSSSGTTINTPVRAEFQQQSDKISGSIGREEDQQAESIRNAKLEDGKHLTFEVSSPEASGLIKFVLTFDDNRMEGQMSGSIDSGPITGKVHLSRAQSRQAAP
jgi:hypothetical protein